MPTPSYPHKNRSKQRDQKRNAPEELDYCCICPKCKAHLELGMSFTIAACVREIVLAKN